MDIERVANILVRNADEAGFVSLTTLVALCAAVGIDEEAVDEAVDGLVELGFVEIRVTRGSDYIFLV